MGESSTKGMLEYLRELIEEALTGTTPVLVGICTGNKDSLDSIMVDSCGVLMEMGELPYHGELDGNMCLVVRDKIVMSFVLGAENAAGLYVPEHNIFVNVKRRKERQ